MHTLLKADGDSCLGRTPQGQLPSLSQEGTLGHWAPLASSRTEGPQDGIPEPSLMSGRTFVGGQGSARYSWVKKQLCVIGHKPNSRNNQEATDSQNQKPQIHKHWCYSELKH